MIDIKYFMDWIGLTSINSYISFSGISVLLMDGNHCAKQPRTFNGLTNFSCDIHLPIAWVDVYHTIVFTVAHSLTMIKTGYTMYKGTNDLQLSLIKF